MSWNLREVEEWKSGNPNSLLRGTVNDPSIDATVTASPECFLGDTSHIDLHWPFASWAFLHCVPQLIWLFACHCQNLEGKDALAFFCGFRCGNTLFTVFFARHLATLHRSEQVDDPDLLNSNVLLHQSQLFIIMFPFPSGRIGKVVFRPDAKNDFVTL